MAFTEDDLLPLSGLQHLAFCERQWALIHIEQQWVENRWTAEGRNMHERCHSEERELRGDTLIVRSLLIRSFVLGVTGVADVIEFKQTPENKSLTPSAARLPGLEGLWHPFPVEYKRGRPKRNSCDAVQLCAQAICLEEMLDVQIDAGALYYGKTHRRQDVMLDDALRQETSYLAERMHAMFIAQTTPPPAYVKKKCDKCSFLILCQPQATRTNQSVERYIQDALDEP